MADTNRQKKEKLIAALELKLAGAEGLIFVNYQGLSHTQLEALRRDLKVIGAEFVAVKNTLLAKVFIERYTHNAMGVVFLSDNNQPLPQTMRSLTILSARLQEKDLSPDEVIMLIPAVIEQEAEAEASHAGVTVILNSAGMQKIAVIKAVRELFPTFGLREAKEMVDSAPKEILTEVTKEQAEAAKAILTAAGATVDLK